jgi:S-adenosyl-L-methionine hydrolase (adenosine-forming)
MRPIVTLLTDFGTIDGYVAEMKGVLYSAVRDITVVDITHDIPPHDVELARLTLARVWRRFPAGTIHIAVVDPGVGSARAALAAQSDGHFLVGPDNGVLSAALLLPGADVVSLRIPPGAAATFHGRDVFTPAAAAIAAGAAIESLGAPFSDPILRRTPEARRRADGAIVGQVIAMDRFGNAITNLVARKGGFAEIDGKRLLIVRTYSDIEEGAAGALVGSSGLMEITVRGSSAERELGLERGSPVVLHPPVSTNQVR